MPLPELSGALGLKRAAHLLRRATFGATRSQIDAYSSLTPIEAIAQLFRTTLPDPAPPNDPKTGLPWYNVTLTDANSKDDVLQSCFKGWFIAQMLSHEVDPAISLAYSAREKLVLFLHAHFTCIQSKVSNSKSMYFQNLLLRFFARDAVTSDAKINFKNLTIKVSIDNAMLKLLDGDLNVKGSPNENYARELFELFSIGRGLEGTLPPPSGPGDYIVYTEQDVQAAAKVLSGWQVDEDFATVDADTTLPRGKVKGSATNASSHDNEPKVFSARFSNAVIQANSTLTNGGQPTEASALDEIRQLIDLIYSKQETAKHICWKLYRFFVYGPHTPESSLAIDGAIISNMADLFVSSGYKIQPVIENLLRSEHFYEAAAGDLKDDNFGGIIKSPIDLVTGAFRTFEVTLPSMATQITDFYKATDDILGILSDLGMNFYEPYDVAGYDAYHQFPIYHRAWITPNYLANRYDFIRSLVDPNRAGMFKVDVYNFVKNNFAGTAPDARLLIIELAKYLLPVSNNLTFDDASDDTATITAKRMNFFKDRFLQQFDEGYWTTRWNENAVDLRDQLAFLFNAMLQSPEYQLA